MKLGDVIFIMLAVGAVFTIFLGMINDETMIKEYDGNNPELNLSGRSLALQRNNTPFYKMHEAITGQQEKGIGNMSSTQTDLEQTSKNSIGLLAIPGAVARGLKTVFTVFSFKFFNTFTASLEQMLGLEVGALSILRTLGNIFLWLVIFLFMGAVLRWIV